MSAIERAYFVLCLGVGGMLRSGRYSTARISSRDGHLVVRKRRLFYAPVLIWLGGPLMKMLDTGLRVLPQREWEERERRIYRMLRGSSIQVDAHGELHLPCLRGKTLAMLLQDADLEERVRRRAIEHAVVALADFHRLGSTHGDAMAENVMVDLDAGVAHWFDFETIHDSRRPMTWRRADDLRALLVTCLVRTDREKRAGTLQHILAAYADEDVTRMLAASFNPVLQRPLAFHLAQAALPFQDFQEIGRMLRG